MQNAAICNLFATTCNASSLRLFDARERISGSRSVGAAAWLTSDPRHGRYRIRAGGARQLAGVVLPLFSYFDGLRSVFISSRGHAAPPERQPNRRERQAPGRYLCFRFRRADRTKRACRTGVEGDGCAAASAHASRRRQVERAAQHMAEREQGALRISPLAWPAAAVNRRAARRGQASATLARGRFRRGS